MDSFIEVGSTKGAKERATTSLEGRYARDLASVILELAEKNCAIDVQTNIGACVDPTNFNDFEKKIIFENADITNWSTEDIGALSSEDRAPVNETCDLSAAEVYEVLRITYGSKAGNIVTNELVDATLCDTPSCGDCDEESAGCNKIFAISVAVGGSPATTSEVIFSLDAGVTWLQHDVDSITGGEAGSGIGCVSDYLVVVSNATASLHYALRDEFDGSTDPSWTEVATGFVAGGEPNACSGVGGRLYVAGDGGYVYYTEDPTGGVTALEEGSLTTDVLNDVHAFSEDIVVAVGNNGAVIYTENGSTFAAANRPTGAAVHLNCVCAKSASHWIVGTNTGRQYVTYNSGTTWVEKAFPGSGSGSVEDIVFATPSIGYMSHTTTAPAGRILRTYDGGYSWVITPERTGATLPANDRVNALVACKYDVNLVVGVGLADDGSDGFVVVGQD